MKRILVVLVLISQNLLAQDYGCDKCDMLREECEVSVSPKKEEICAFFRKECLETDTVYVSDNGAIAKPAVASNYQVVAKGKCIQYKEVKEYVKATKQEVRSYQVNKKDTIYTFATTYAMFPGGDAKLVSFLSKNIKYPEAAKANKKEGTVYVKFIVNKTGSITGIKALRSPDPALSAEALRVVKIMPKWTPATYKSDPVSMNYILPVKFKIK